MKVFTYSEARQRLAEVLDTARTGEVLITRRNGDTFSLTCKTSPKSPLDVPCVRTQATTADILDVLQESRTGRL